MMTCDLARNVTSSVSNLLAFPQLTSLGQSGSAVLRGGVVCRVAVALTAGNTAFGVSDDVLISGHFIKIGE